MQFIDPNDKDFDPVNPRIEVDGFGSYRRLELRNKIKSILKSLFQKITTLPKPESDKEISVDGMSKSYTKFELRDITKNILKSLFSKIKKIRGVEPSFDEMSAILSELNPDSKLMSLLKADAKGNVNNATMDDLKNILTDLNPDNELMSMLRADIGASKELEQLRQKGGQRRNDIPRQD